MRDNPASTLPSTWPNRGGSLAVDEAGLLKVGLKYVGVRRHRTGTSGLVENSQVSLFLACKRAAPRFNWP